jgi:Ca2+-binding EF-hand superfamily protein
MATEPSTPRTPASGNRRAQKVQQIFQVFDKNGDGALSKEEMANLVIAVNPRVKFSEDQIKAILDEVSVQNRPKHAMQL